MTKNNSHIGSSFDDFLAEENLLTETEEATIPQQGNEFWKGLQELRATIEREGIIIDDDDFANLRDRSPGREIDL